MSHFSLSLLKKNLCGEQYRPRRGPCLCDLSECAAARRRVGGIELRVVQRIDAFEAQLELDSFFQPCVLDDCQVQVVRAIGSYTRKSRIQGSQILTGLQPRIPFKSSVDVEPAVHGPLAVRNRNV